MTTRNEKLEHFITCLRAQENGREVQFDYAESGWSKNEGITNYAFAGFSPIPAAVANSRIDLAKGGAK